MTSSPPILPSLWTLVALLLAACTPSPPQGPVVLAASSTQEALTEAAATWAEQGHPPPLLSFSSSAAVARQLAEGAPADLALTADAEWMDWLQAEGLVRPGTRREVAGNRLVLVKPEGSGPVELTALGTGRLALADPASVPAGRYARAALEHLALWEQLREQIVPAENVRAALALVERGEAALGIVYASDALASRRVERVAYLPQGSYPPIRYPVAVAQASRHPDSAGFAAFLASPEALAIFVAHGFDTPP